MMRRLGAATLLAAPLLFSAAAAQEAAPASETSVFLFNTLILLAAGVLITLMAAGFCLLEAGLVRAKNAASAGIKTIGVWSGVALMMWLTGFSLLRGVETGGFLGTFGLWAPADVDPVGKSYASSADFFFATAFAAIAALIVTGALAERVKLAAALVFAAAFAGLIYPIAASWGWGGGYLDAEWRFVDFAGAAFVHAAGGAAALAGALIVGARRGKYHQGDVAAPAGSNLPIAALGVFLVWIGWFGALAASNLSFGSVGDAISVAKIIVNANLAGAGGVVAAIVMTSLIYQRVDVRVALNAAIGGLVSISAEPLAPALWQSALIGGFGGVIVTAGAPFLDRLKIDDSVGAIPSHLFCGVWGTLVAPWTNPDSAILGQIVGILMIVAFAFSMSALVWTTLKYSIGVRTGAESELAGLDRTELDAGAYPEFAPP